MTRKIRLTDGMRRRLMEHARRLVDCPAERDVQERAYRVAEPLVLQIVHDFYPPRDMKVCLRHKAAQEVDRVYLRLAAGGDQQFLFQGNGPAVVNSRQIYACDAPASHAVSNWVKAFNAHKAAREAKLADYQALISTARTLEEVAVVWPEAEQLRPHFQSSLPTVLSADVITRIQADVAQRTGSHPEGAR